MFLKTTGIGRLTRDPELRYTPSGMTVTTLSVATDKYISKDRTPECPADWKESYNGKGWVLTTFVRLSAWGNLAETCNLYLSKGRQIYFEAELNGTAKDGILNANVWESNGGEYRASFEFTARVVKFLGNGNNTVAKEDNDDNELPF